MAGAPVRADPDQLEDVARLLGVFEGAQVMRVVRAAVALERREHREHRVGRRERLRVARLRRDLERPARVRAARVGLCTEPVRRGAPRKEQRDVPGLTRLVRSAVDGERLVEPAAEMEQQAHAPREAGRKTCSLLGGPLEATQGLVPVAANLVGLAGELLDRGRAERPGEATRSVEDGVDCAA